MTWPTMSEFAAWLSEFKMINGVPAAPGSCYTYLSQFQTPEISDEEIEAMAWDASIKFHEYENTYFKIAWEQGYRAALERMKK